MSKATRSGFDDRDKWALEMQSRYAVDIYCEYWAIPESDVTEVDQLRGDEVAAKLLDTQGGTDKVVTPSTGIRHIAQRFRTRDREFGDPDFSIRVSSYSDKDTEYDKIMNAFRNGGNVPQIYSFGIADGYTKSEGLENGFYSFHFIDFPRFLQLFDSGHIQPIACYANGDGSEALYFNIDDLRQKHAVTQTISGDVLESAWADRQTSDEFPTAPGVKTTGQVELFDFGGDTQ